jgi:hypothetical protein
LFGAIDAIRARHPNCRIALPLRAKLGVRACRLPAPEELPASFAFEDLYGGIDFPLRRAGPAALVEVIDRFRPLFASPDYLRLDVRVQGPSSSRWPGHIDGELYLFLAGPRADLNVRVGYDASLFGTGIGESQFQRLQAQHQKRLFQEIARAADLPADQTSDGGLFGWMVNLQGEPTPRLVERVLAAAGACGAGRKWKVGLVVGPRRRTSLLPAYRALQGVTGPAQHSRLGVTFQAGSDTPEAVRLLLQGTRKGVRFPLGSLHLPRAPGVNSAAAYFTLRTNARGHDVSVKTLGDASRLLPLLAGLGITTP